MPKDTFFKLNDEKRNCIRNVVLEIFAEEKYEDVGIRSMISRMDISIGSFYKYFEDKDEMYLHYFSEIESRLIAAEAQHMKSFFNRSCRFDVTTLLDDKELAFMQSWYRVPEQVYMKFYYGGYAHKINWRLENELNDLFNQGKLREGLSAELAYYFMITAMFSFLIYVRRKGLENHRLEIMPIKNFYYEKMIFNSILNESYYHELFKD